MASSSSEASEVMVPIRAVYRVNNKSRIMCVKAPAMTDIEFVVEKSNGVSFMKHEGYLYGLSSPKVTINTRNVIGESCNFKAHIKQHGSYYLAGYEVMSITLKPSSEVAIISDETNEHKFVTLKDVPEPVSKRMLECGVLIGVTFRVPLSKMDGFMFDQTSH